MENLFLLEKESTRATLSNTDCLAKILNFQLKYDVQIIRGEDYQYMCYIDKKVYSTALTPMFALVSGIDTFIENNK